MGILEAYVNEEIIEACTYGKHKSREVSKYHRSCGGTVVTQGHPSSK